MGQGNVGGWQDHWGHLPQTRASTRWGNSTSAPLATQAILPVLTAPVGKRSQLRSPTSAAETGVPSISSPSPGDFSARIPPPGIPSQAHAVPAQVPETVTGHFKAAGKGARSARKKQQSKKPKPRRLARPIRSPLRSRFLLPSFLTCRACSGRVLLFPTLPRCQLQHLLTPPGCWKEEAPHPRKGKLELELGGRCKPDKRSCSPTAVRPKGTSKVSSRKRWEGKKNAEALVSSQIPSL